MPWLMASSSTLKARKASSNLSLISASTVTSSLTLTLLLPPQKVLCHYIAPIFGIQNNLRISGCLITPVKSLLLCKVIVLVGLGC